MNRFLFSEINPESYATLRIAFGLLTTLYLLQLFPLSVIHFSDDGWLITIPSDLYHADQWSVLYWFASTNQTHVFFVLAIFFSLGFTIGLKTKFCGFVTLIALISIYNRNPLIMDGDDAVLRIMLFYLILSPCGQVWSLDAKKYVGKYRSFIWPLRMIQFQIALIYFGSGWVKFHSPEWSNGTVLEYVLIHPDYSRWDFTPLLHSSAVRAVLEVLAHVIKWWELLFPILLIHPVTRLIALLLGIIFHVGLLVSMDHAVFVYRIYSQLFFWI